MRCDSHIHIVGPLDRFAQVANRTYTAGIAALDRIEHLGAGHGIGRFVIVQPSFYGTDNAALLDGLDRLGPRGRGVAVIDPAATSAAMLGEFHARGVRGLRINLYSPMQASRVHTMAEAFAAQAAVAATIGWHVEVIAPIEGLIAAADTLARSSVPVVIDHYGLYGGHDPASETGRRLLDLVRLPHVWIKLSAPYRVSDDPLNSCPDRRWLAALIDAAPGRCVWGSDWPHTPAHDAHGPTPQPLSYRPISYAALITDFTAALPAPDLAGPILTTNPARLYGFQD